MSTRAPGPSPPDLENLVPIPTYRGQPATRTAPVRGLDPWGSPVSVDITQPGGVLLVFLSTTCDGCERLWNELSAKARHRLPGAGLVAIVTRGPDHEDAVGVASLITEETTVVMSDETWDAYRIHGPPFFVVVGADGTRVITEGVAVDLKQIADHLEHAYQKAKAEDL